MAPGTVKGKSDLNFLFKLNLNRSVVRRHRFDCGALCRQQLAQRKNLQINKLFGDYAILA
jgi:hypothetical protein